MSESGRSPVEEAVADLAVSTRFSRAELDSMVVELREEAAIQGRELRDEWIPALIKVAVEMETAAPAQYHLRSRTWTGRAVPAIIAALPTGR